MSDRRFPARAQEFLDANREVRTSATAIPFVFLEVYQVFIVGIGFTLNEEPSRPIIDTYFHWMLG